MSNGDQRGDRFVSTAIERKGTTTTAVARPLSALVPLIQSELAGAERAGMENYREAGRMLLEAQQRMRDDGTYYRKRKGGHPGLCSFSGKWGKWLEKNFSLSTTSAAHYMRLAALPDERAASIRVREQAIRDVNAPIVTRRALASAERALIRKQIEVDIDAAAKGAA